MPARQLLSPWLIVSVFTLSATAVPLLDQLLRPPVTPPRTLVELIELVGQCEPPFHAVLENDRNPEGGVYLCERPQSHGQLQHLLRVPEYADDWRGVVFCERAGKCSEIQDLESWSEHGLRIGPLLFFGDPDLLQRIHRAILQQRPG